MLSASVADSFRVVVVVSDNSEFVIHPLSDSGDESRPFTTPVLGEHQVEGIH